MGTTSRERDTRVAHGPRASANVAKNWPCLSRTGHPGAPMARELVRSLRIIGPTSRELDPPGGPRPES